MTSHAFERSCKLLATKKLNIWNDGNRLNTSWFGAEYIARVRPPSDFNIDFRDKTCEKTVYMGPPGPSTINRAGVTIPSGGFFAQRLAAQARHLMGSAGAGIKP